MYWINRSDMVNELKGEYPNLAKYTALPLVREIAAHFALFESDKSMLAAAVLQEPFHHSYNFEQIAADFDQKVAQNLQDQAELHNLNPKFLDDYDGNKAGIILHLINYQFFLKNENEVPGIRKLITPERIKYLMQLLEKSDISDIRSELEDPFFKILEPEVFSHYEQLLKFTTKSHEQREHDLKHKVLKLANDNDIEIEIEFRIKSIFSIHKKIVKKKILYSQVLDTIGLRLIVNSEKECYQLMGILLKAWPVISNKLKDYIAVPKRNGYQSIHLTIIDGEQPVEIQIRTKEMHHFAQYGQASHLKYKLSKHGST